LISYLSQYGQKVETRSKLDNLQILEHTNGVSSRREIIAHYNLMQIVTPRRTLFFPGVIY
jgi:hypothetical protein